MSKGTQFPETVDPVSDLDSGDETDIYDPDDQDMECDDDGDDVGDHAKDVGEDVADAQDHAYAIDNDVDDNVINRDDGVGKSGGTNDDDNNVHDDDNEDKGGRNYEGYDDWDSFDDVSFDDVSTDGGSMEEIPWGDDSGKPLTWDDRPVTLVNCAPPWTDDVPFWDDE